MDIAHKATDKEIKKLDKHIKTQYARAQKEIADIIEKKLDKLKAVDNEWLAKMSQAAGEDKAKLTQAWLKDRGYKLAEIERKAALSDNIAKHISQYNIVGIDAVNASLPNVYAINHNWATYELETGTKLDLSFSIYDKNTVDRLLKDNPKLLPTKKLNKAKDIAWNEKKIRNEILQGVLQGKPIDKVAEGLQRVTDMNRSSAMKNARTMMTGAQNAGRQDGYKQAQSMGIEMKRRWIATLDERTRDSHRDLDGQTVEVDEPFKGMYGELMYPGDPNGHPADVYNCRCTVRVVIKGTEGFEGQRRDNINGKIISGMSYREWEKARI